MEKTLTVREAADELGYREMTVYIKIQKQQIKVRRHGRYVRISREDNMQLFDDRKALTASV